MYTRYVKILLIELLFIVAIIFLIWSDNIDLSKFVSYWNDKNYTTNNDGENLSLNNRRTSVSKNSKTLPDNAKIVSAEEINNVGYSFLLAQIDYSDSQGLSDKTKNDITNIIYKAHFPQRQLFNMVFVIVNTLAVHPNNTYIITSGAQIPAANLPPVFLKGGGVYRGTYGENNASVIFISKNIIGNQAQLEEVLTHELGHHIGSKMTDAEWKEYYKLRNIPPDTARTGGERRLSPLEDFAEVYKNIFTDSNVNTVYGLLMPTMGIDMVSKCDKIYSELVDIFFKQKIKEEGFDINSFKYQFMSKMDEYQEVKESVDNNSELQSCRKEILLNPEKYKNDYLLGAPYKAIVTDETKKFVNEIILRLNK